MSVAGTLGTPVKDRDDPPPFPLRACRKAEPIPEAPAPDAPRRPPWIWMAVAATAVVVVVIAGLLVGWAMGGRPVSQPVSIAPSEVTSLAEFFVAAHVSGTTPSDDLTAIASRPHRGDGATGYWVNRAAAVAAEPSGDGTWTVTVAADVLEAAGDVYESAGIHYYQVGVDTLGSTPVVTSGPARVPRPEPTVMVDHLTRPAAPDQQAAIVSFLERYLTGRDESGRYPPGSVSPMFAEPPYVSIEVAEVVSDPAGGVLRARVTATAASGAVTRLEYLLSATTQTGLWEVTPSHTAGDTLE